MTRKKTDDNNNDNYSNSFDNDNNNNDTVNLAVLQRRVGNLTAPWWKPDGALAET